MKISICPICGTEHTKRRSKCCCIEHSKELSRRNTPRKPIVEKICPKCGNKHTKPGIFCSRHCANSREQTTEIRQKKSIAARRYLERIGKPYKMDKVCTCLNCGKKFYLSNSSVRKYCSKECRVIATHEAALAGIKKGIEVMKSHHNLGGYREGSGRSKSGYYKGVYCGSTYELVWLIYQIDHGKDFKRFEGMLEWNGVKYIPDFIQDGKIIELKGYWQVKVDQKCEVARHFGYEIEVLYRKDLTKEFEWVKQHYTYHDLEELYDDYAPKYTYVCTYCGKEFTRNKRIRTQTTLCSRKCAGKMVAKRLYTPHSNN